MSKQRKQRDTILGNLSELVNVVVKGSTRTAINLTNAAEDGSAMLAQTTTLARVHNSIWVGEAVQALTEDEYAYVQKALPNRVLPTRNATGALPSPSEPPA